MSTLAPPRDPRFRRTLTPAELTAHIEELARQVGAYVLYDAPPFSGEMNTRTRIAHVQPIQDFGYVTPPDGGQPIRHTSNVTYFVALHELGHAATAPVLAFPPRDEELLEYEALAWDWAIKHSAIPVDRDMAHMAARALDNYQQNSRLAVRQSPPKSFELTRRELNDLAAAA